jgi:hypothetical protein
VVATAAIRLAAQYDCVSLPVGRWEELGTASAAAGRGTCWREASQPALASAEDPCHDLEPAPILMKQHTYEMGTIMAEIIVENIGQQITYTMAVYDVDGNKIGSIIQYDANAGIECAAAWTTQQISAYGPR